MSRGKRNVVRNSGASPTPEESVRVAEIAVVSQFQEQLEEAMAEAGVSRDQLAGAMRLTRAMVDHMLDTPNVALHDLTALGVVLGISFRVTRYRSGT